MPGLSFCGGYGSKGVMLAPRLATLLADWLEGRGEIVARSQPAALQRLAARERRVRAETGRGLTRPIFQVSSDVHFRAYLARAGKVGKTFTARGLHGGGCTGAWLPIFFRIPTD